MPFVRGDPEGRRPRRLPFLVARARHRQESRRSNRGDQSHDDHEEGHRPPHRASRPRRDRGPAAARQHGAGGHGPGRRRRPRRSSGSGSSTCRTARSCAQWTPAQEGANFEFSPILKPLEDVPQGPDGAVATSSNYGENGHSVSSAMWLSGTFPAKGSAAEAGDDRRSAHRQEDRAATRRSRRWSSPPRITRATWAAAPATSCART